MAFKDLHRFVQILTPQENKKMDELAIKCQHTPFYRWSSTHLNQKRLHTIGNNHRGKSQYCCFNHLIGLPSKNGTPFPLFDYEKEIYKALVKPWHLNSDITSTDKLDNIDSLVERRQETF